jgi:hypothetical protein
MLNEILVIFEGRSLPLIQTGQNIPPLTPCRQCGGSARSWDPPRGWGEILSAEAHPGRPGTGRRGGQKWAHVHFHGFRVPPIGMRDCLRWCGSHEKETRFFLAVGSVWQVLDKKSQKMDQQTWGSNACQRDSALRALGEAHGVSGILFALPMV